MAKDPRIPIFVVNSEQQIDITIDQTQAQLADQGYTYNQPGFTYNQAGWQYGGIYNQNQDLAPVFFNDTASFISLSISGIVDIYKPPPVPNNQKVVGIGWWMYIAQV